MEPETWGKGTPSSGSVFPGAEASVLAVGGGAGLLGGGHGDEGPSLDPVLVVDYVSGYP